MQVYHHGIKFQFTPRSHILVAWDELDQHVTVLTLQSGSGALVFRRASTVKAKCDQFDTDCPDCS